jgi:tRNA wybutosine-synthesizing protein 3
MDFDIKKKSTLLKEDHSKKGSVDHQIKHLIDRINLLENYYTTSSCAGRIDLILLSNSRRKDESEWLYVTHEPADIKKIMETLENYSKKSKGDTNDEIWFKMESSIIHVCCRTLESATELLNLSKEAGYKHSGILSLGGRIILEIFSTEKIEALVAKDAKVLVDEDYLTEITKIANKRLTQTRKKIDRLYNQLE